MSQPPSQSRFDRPPVIAPGHSFGSITDKISSIVLRKDTPKGWILGFGIAFLMVMMMLFAIGWLLLWGVGVWGLNNPVFWGFDITNFVWWVGIGHAGTLISAILLLLKQEWRTSINRFAEAMTLFAVACAGLFPALHTGRPWFDYWLMPYPNTMALWPQFRSPLVWDVFAISTYGTVSGAYASCEDWVAQHGAGDSRCRPGGLSRSLCARRNGRMDRAVTQAAAVSLF